MLTAVALVMITCVATLGIRPALMIGTSIPISFMIAFLVVQMLGMTVNMMIMFGLVLAVGVLVDDPIVVVEYAERKIAEGVPKREAFILAAPQDVRAGGFGQLHHPRRLHSAAVLAGHHRQVHELSADHRYRGDVRIAAFGADLHAGDRRHHRPLACRRGREGSRRRRHVSGQVRHQEGPRLPPATMSASSPICCTGRCPRCWSASASSSPSSCSRIRLAWSRSRRRRPSSARSTSWPSATSRRSRSATCWSRSRTRCCR